MATERGTKERWQHDKPQVRFALIAVDVYASSNETWAMLRRAINNSEPGMRAAGGFVHELGFAAAREPGRAEVDAATPPPSDAIVRQKRKVGGAVMRR